MLEALAERGPLTVEQVAELVELRPKALQWQKKKDYEAARTLARKVAADRVVVLEKLTEQGRLTDEQEAELAELRSTAAARVAELEELAGRGPLTDEQATELAELRSKVAARGRKKKDRDVTETGVGDPVVGRGAADAGVMLGADAYEEPRLLMSWLRPGCG
ncbi:hypothetical protein [Saccharopolyspora spinosa]|uniref:hypothetical protein n=1 Tax=Saccharopolyspora spinosa TaxID=60894 RepID=UPI002351E37F|nr:hypothetical protein [Saccharopolyspora spinosa]